MAKFRNGRWVDIPEYMKKNAQKALDWHEEYGRGLTDVGIQSAKYLAEGSFPLERLGRAKSYLARAIPNYGDVADETEDDGGPTEARIALHAWGSDGDDGALDKFSKAYEQYQEEREDSIARVRTDAKETFDLKRKKKTPEGYLDVWGVAASVVPLEYSESDPGGERVEMPTPEALIKSSTSLEGCPVTLEHPPVGLLTSENAKEFTVGTVMKAWFDEPSGQLRVRLRIVDEEAIQALERGFKDSTSPGYRVVKWRETSDEEKDKTGADVFQELREHNHLAIVSAPRGEAPLRLDANGDPIQKDEDMPGKHKNKDMENEDMEQEDMEKEDMEQEDMSKEYEDMSKADMLAEMMDMKKERDDAMSKLDEAMSKMDKMEAKLDAMEKGMDGKGEMKGNEDTEEEDEMEDSRADSIYSDPERFGAAVREHNRAMKAAELMGIPAEFEEPTLKIKAKVVQKDVGNEVRVDSKSKDYIETYFDMIMSNVQAREANTPSHLHDHVKKRRFDSVSDALDGLEIVSRRDQMNRYND